MMIVFDLPPSIYYRQKGGGIMMPRRPDIDDLIFDDEENHISER